MNNMQVNISKSKHGSIWALYEKDFGLYLIHSSRHNISYVNIDPKYIRKTHRALKSLLLKAKENPKETNFEHINEATAIAFLSEFYNGQGIFEISEAGVFHVLTVLEAQKLCNFLTDVVFEEFDIKELAEDFVKNSRKKQ